MQQPFMQQPIQQAWTQEEREEFKRKEDRRAQRARMEEKVALEEKKGNTNFAMMLTVMMFSNSILLVLPMIHNSWGQKQFTGLGVSSWVIKTSLFEMQVAMDCRKSFVLESAMCQMVAKNVDICEKGAKGCERGDEPLGRPTKRWQGTHTLHEAQGLACAVGNTHVCSVMSRIYLSSFIIFSTFSLTVIMNAIGSLTLYAYWFQNPLPKFKYIALTLIYASPVVGILGLVMWSVFVPDLGQLATAWTQQTVLLTGGSDILAYKEVSSFGFGMSWIIACVVLLWMFILCMITACMFRSHDGEEEAAEEEERQQQAANDYLASLQGGMAVPGHMGTAKPSPFPPGPSQGVPGGWPADGTWQGPGQPGAWQGPDTWQPGPGPQLGPQSPQYAHMG